MKNLYTKNEFLTIVDDYDMINEGFFDFIGKMFNKARNYINKVKGGKEIDLIYKKYVALIERDIKKNDRTRF